MKRSFVFAGLLLGTIAAAACSSSSDDGLGAGSSGSSGEIPPVDEAGSPTDSGSASDTSAPIVDSGGDNITFQQDHAPTTPASQWKTGQTVTDGPWEITVPQNVAPGDYYWGCGKDGSGKNRLGAILEQVREQLRQEA